jgi:hypothetical protein
MDAAPCQQTRHQPGSALPFCRFVHCRTLPGASRHGFPPACLKFFFKLNCRSYVFNGCSEKKKAFVSVPVHKNINLI